MRGFAGWAVAVGLAGGCAKAPVAVVDAGPAKGHPDLRCPVGARPEGFGPPNGRAAWCVLSLPDGRTVKDGPALEWHENGAIAASGAWADDLQTGEWIRYFPTGTPESRGTYVAGKKDGVFTTFAPGGEKVAEGPFVNGAEHGAWTFWNTETLVRTEGAYVLGDRDGVWRDYTPEGKATRERVYRDGRLVTQREL